MRAVLAFKPAEPVEALVRAGAQVVALVKPQFEVGRGRVGKGGIVRDPALWREVLAGLLDHVVAAGDAAIGWCESPIAGADARAQALRGTVASVVGDAEFGRFSLETTQVAPATVFRA